MGALETTPVKIAPPPVPHLPSQAFVFSALLPFRKLLRMGL